MLTLPEYPWESLAPYRRAAEGHPGGISDLSIGTPVDDTPELIQQALAAAANAHGYPTTHGTPELREAIAGWYGRRRGVTGLDPQAVIPTVGSKEFIAWLPLLLGIGPGDVVVRPTVAYPTYDIGALLVGAMYGKTLAWSLGTPLIGVNHLEDVVVDAFQAGIYSLRSAHPRSVAYAVLGAMASRRILADDPLVGSFLDRVVPGL